MSKSLYKIRYLDDYYDDIPKLRNSKLIIHMNGSSLDGSSLFTEKRFVPPMINPRLYDAFSNILFKSNIKLTDKMFPPDMADNDKRKIFLVPSRFETFFQAARRTGSFPVLSDNEVKESNTIENNASFLLNLFLPKNSSFYYNGNIYRIYNYEWNKKYFITKTQQRERVKTMDIVGRPKYVVEKHKTQSKDNYNVNISLILKRGTANVTVLDSVKLSCSQRREQIWDKWDTLMNIGYDSKITAAKEAIKEARKEEPSIEDGKEREEYEARFKELKAKKKRTEKEKGQYNDYKAKRKVKQKRKSPKPSMLTTRTYYTSPSSLEQFNKINRDKKERDIPVAYPIVEPYLASGRKGGTKKKYNISRSRKKTIKRKRRM